MVPLSPSRVIRPSAVVADARGSSPIVHALLSHAWTSAVPFRIERKVQMVFMDLPPRSVLLCAVFGADVICDGVPFDDRRAFHSIPDGR